MRRRPGGVHRRVFARLIDQRAVAFERERALRGQDAQLQAQVFQRRALPDQVLEMAAPGDRSRARSWQRRYEQRVDPIAEVELLLQARERNERGADVALLRLQRELTERRCRQDGAHGQANGAARHRLSGRAATRAGWPTVSGDASRTVAPASARELAGERRAEEHFARAWRCGGVLRVGHAMKSPEPVVDAVNLHARGAPAAGLCGGGALYGDERRNVLEVARRTPDRSAGRRRARRGKNRSRPARRSVAPSRCSTRSRRLPRTESPTRSAPDNTVTAAATPATTATFVRQ